jgi:Mg2+-importing ATPase
MALRARKHVVGYIGDGINDAPSLHAADVGISVANAVDVAKDAAELAHLNRAETKGSAAMPGHGGCGNHPRPIQ